jgi:hypothetical protein
VVRPILSALNPSVSPDRSVHVAYNARQATQASLETSFAARRVPVLADLNAAWKSSRPRYTGPADNPFKNTIKDFADNPEFYSEAAVSLRQAARAYNRVSDEILAETRSQYNVDLAPFVSGKPDTFYLPTLPSREVLDEAIDKVGSSYTSTSLTGKASPTKRRIYEGAYQRWKKNPNFSAETDIERLTELHDRALARVAGNETFRAGANGKTRLEVMTETHP